MEENFSASVNASPDEWTQVGAAAAPLVRKAATPRSLADRAMVVELERSMYTPYVRDRLETDAYGAGSVNKHLFKGDGNRVAKALAAYKAVYQYVVGHTLPWGKGEYLLKAESYFEFGNNIRNLTTAADAAVADLVANWGAEVQADIARLSRIAATNGKAHIASPDDYPAAEELEKKFSIRVVYKPVPETDHFKHLLTPEDMENFQQQIVDAENAAMAHVVRSVLEPIQYAAMRLTEADNSEQTASFRNTLIANIDDAAARMIVANVSDDPDLMDQLHRVRAMVAPFLGRENALRRDPEARAEARQSLDSLAAAMAAFA